MAVNQGKQTFQKQWGKRENADNWRRVNQTVVNFQTNQETPESTEMPGGQDNAGNPENLQSLGSLATDSIQPGDSVDLHNLPMTITVKCRKTPNDDIVNEIKGYAAKENTSGNAAQQSPGTAPSAPPWARQ